MSNGAWIDTGQDPYYGKYQHHGITVPYFDPRDPRVTSAYLDNVKSRGMEACGIYTAWNWDLSFQDPRVYAEWTDQQLKRIGWQGNAWVILDIEKGSGLNDNNYVTYVISCLTRWRQLRATRPTTYTLEGMQGGLFPSASVSAIRNLNVRVAPQLYTGTMTPQPHSVMLDLLMAGFPGERLDGIYDAAALPYRWRGVAYTQGRLP